MVGFCCACDRETAVPMTIESGCDVFLFNRNIDEDYEYMHRGYEKGIMSDARLEEAVKRILATKAALGLNTKKKKGTLVPDEDALKVLNCKEHDSWARECADKGVTLVKDTQNLLPISPVKHKRILLQILGEYESNDRVQRFFVDKLTKEGFDVTVYVKEGFEVMDDSVAKLKERYDLVMYVANIETASNHTVARINWHTMFGLGTNMPWMVYEMPVMFISVGNPYHLLDAPMVKTFINGYCNSEYVMSAVIDKIMGRSPFKGVSPIDPFCGRQDLRF
jgi:beta-N-acetylhexosaminidase